MLKEKNFTLKGKTDKPIVTDVFFDATRTPKPIVIFCHGYKGFKDWGAWNLMAENFAKNGYFFIKFNFSHNGGTPENPLDFPDLDAFAENNYSKQLDDLESVIDWIITTKAFTKDADVEDLNLIGHSRGGGIVLIKASENKHVKGVSTFAAVSDFESRFPQGKKLQDWKEDGVYYVENSRTHQKMPHHFQFYKDFIAHKERFTIKRAVRHLKIPQLIIHAKDDSSVKPKNAELLHQWNPKAELYLIESGGHTFGAKHPWEQDNMPDQLKSISDKTIRFFKK